MFIKRGDGKEGKILNIVDDQELKQPIKEALQEIEKKNKDQKLATSVN